MDETTFFRIIVHSASDLMRKFGCRSCWTAAGFQGALENPSLNVLTLLVRAFYPFLLILLARSEYLCKSFTEEFSLKRNMHMPR